MMSGNDFDYLFKLSLIGDSGVGIRHLMKKYAENTYSESYISTMGMNSIVKDINIDGEKIKSSIGYQGGENLEKNHDTNKSASRSHAFIAVFDLSNPISFQNIDKYIEQIRKHYITSDTTIMLVGTKSDLPASQQVITKKMMEEKAKKLRLDFCVMCSAKTGENVDSLFEVTNRICLNKLKANIERMVISAAITYKNTTTSTSGFFNFFGSLFKFSPAAPTQDRANEHSVNERDAKRIALTRQP